MIITYENYKDIFHEDTKSLQVLLCQLGLLDNNDITGYFGLNTEKAFKVYQKMNGKVPNGKFDTSLFNFDDEEDNSDNDGKLLTPRLINNEVNERSVEQTNKDKLPFFNDNKEYVFRKGNIDVEIEYANSLRQNRKIEGIKIRSVSQMIDSTGEVIADVYDFIARDLIENN